METRPDNELPGDAGAFEALSKAQQRRLAQQDAALKQANNKIRFLLAKLEKFEAERRLERAKRFGASSEKGDYQANLFDEAEQHQGDAADDPDGLPDDDAIDASADQKLEVTAHTKRRPKRKPLPTDLPRVTVEHDLDDTGCQCCGDAMVRIGSKTSEQVGVIPAQCYVIENVRHQYSCRRCNSVPATAPMTPQPIPKSMASADLLAHTAVSKYVDGLPLYRQTAMFKRVGVNLPRQTLARHMVRAGELVSPLIERMVKHALAYDVLGIDETRCQVLKEPGKRAQSQSYMWVMRGGPPQEPIIRFHYDPGRDQGVPLKLLEHYHGYLQRDGYAGYNAVAKRNDIIGVACWAHVRRKYTDTLKGQKNPKAGRAHQALAFIQKLYAIEKRMASLEPDEKRTIRQSESLPVLSRFRTWLDRQHVTPSGLLGGAIRYTLNEWPHLLVYCDDGRINIDNNPVENAIRPFAVGRRNWLFCDTQDGARASANLYSLVETARANQINPYAYLKWIFKQLPQAATAEQIDALLPWHVNPDDMMNMMTVPTLP